MAIEWAVAGGLEAELNPPEIELVLINLAANAFEAMLGTADRRLRISAGSWRALAIVAVGDSGPGVPAEMRASLFRSLPAGRAQGRGIGLYLCRTIVAGHGGRIWAEQGAQGGAVLKFTLPLAPWPSRGAKPAVPRYRGPAADGVVER